MNAIYAAPLGIAAALAGTPADANAQEAPEPAPLAQPAGATDLLAPELVEVAERLEASDPAKICDDKCQVLVLTEATLPGTGAADLLSVVLEPQEHGFSIPKSDGSPALTFTVMPTKIARGQGLVATAKF
jgi:hypothetical protein